MELILKRLIGRPVKCVTRWYARSFHFVLGLIVANIVLQYRILIRNIEDLTFIVVMPLQTFVTIPFFIAAGRVDLAPYALTSSLLFTVGQMGFFVASEILAKDRGNAILQLLVASPAPYSLILAIRTISVCLIGLVGFAESWAIAYCFFGVHVEIHHWGPFVVTLALTSLVGGCSAVLVSAIFGLARNVRTLQNAINGPLYLLGGVLVPTSYLPAGLQLISPMVFLYWSANLVRDSISTAPIEALYSRLTCLATLGGLTLAMGILLVRRMIEKLRTTGNISLS